MQRLLASVLIAAAFASAVAEGFAEGAARADPCGSDPCCCCDDGDAGAADAGGCTSDGRCGAPAPAATLVSACGCGDAGGHPAVASSPHGPRTIPAGAGAPPEPAPTLRRRAAVHVRLASGAWSPDPPVPRAV